MSHRTQRRIGRRLAGCCAALLSVVFGAFAHAQIRGPITAPSTTTAPATRPVLRPSGEPIPDATLQQMYQRELGAKYNPADAARLLAVHRLIEEYFETSPAQDRKAIVGRIEAIGLDPGVVGRLTRLRMYWPALEGGVYYVNEKVGPLDARYFLGLPKGYDRTRHWPLVIKLPATHAFTTDPPPDADQVTAIYNEWMEDELARHPDAIVVMPLLNLSELYGPSYAGMNTVVQPMLHVAGRVNMDPARVYLVGHSMAAHAVWNLGLHYTTYFAAINPMAGGCAADWQRLRLMNLRNVLPVVWTDASDTVIKPEASRAPVRVLRNLKVDVEYDETQNLGHAPDDATVERLYAKMRARSRELYPVQELLQSSRPDPMFNRIDWLQVWQPISTGKERSVPLKYGSGRMVLYEATYTVTADRQANNKFDLTTQNVDSLRLYLNDQMVDFAKPLSIVVNKKVRFEGTVKQSVEEMLKDQLFLGRGWRYFTAALDIDLVERPATRPTSRPTTQPATRKGTITVGPAARD